MSGAILRRRDRTARSLRVVHYSSAVNIFASYANRAACKECQLKSKCTKSAFRRVLRYVDEAILERMAERLAARPELLDARRESVEHPFGSIKQWMGQGALP